MNDDAVDDFLARLGAEPGEPPPHLRSAVSMAQAFSPPPRPAAPDSDIVEMLAAHPTPWKAMWENCGTPGMEDCGAWTVLDANDRPVAMLGDSDDDETLANGIAALANEWAPRHRPTGEEPPGLRGVV